MSLDPAWAPVARGAGRGRAARRLRRHPRADRRRPRPCGTVARGGHGAVGGGAAARALVAVVTGRPVAFVREHVADPTHRGGGAVRIRARRRHRHRDRSARRRVRAGGRRRGADLERSWPALRVERKGETAITLHWREHPESVPDAGAVAAIADAHGLVAWPARMACELRPPVAVDKGTAVARSARRASPAGRGVRRRRRRRPAGVHRARRVGGRVADAARAADRDRVRRVADRAARPRPTSWWPDRRTSPISSRALAGRDLIGEPVARRPGGGEVAQARRATVPLVGVHDQRVVQRVGARARRRTGAPAPPPSRARRTRLPRVRGRARRHAGLRAAPPSPRD